MITSQDFSAISPEYLQKISDSLDELDMAFRMINQVEDIAFNSPASNHSRIHQMRFCAEYVRFSLEAISDCLHDIWEAEQEDADSK